MDVEELIKTIEVTANPEMAAKWDKSGLQVASERKNIRKIVVMLDPLPENIKKGLESGADFILSHHPLSIKPELPIKIDNFYHALKLLLGANVPLYSAHTSLDVNPEGPAGWLGRDLGLSSCVCLENIGEKRGYGEIGNLPVALSVSDFIDRVLHLLNIGNAAVCGPTPAHSIERIAYCGGSGASLVENARNMGAQIFITGDVKYHTALNTEIMILDVGHHSLEEEMMKRFAHLLKIELPEIEVIFLPSRSPFEIIREKGNEQQ